MFRAINGKDAMPKMHCFGWVLTMEEHALALWVKRTIASKREFEKGKSSYLTRELIVVLSQAGFIWPKGKDEAWEVMYSDLAVFFKSNGHSDVPQRGTNKALGVWVNAQRKAYTNLKNDKATSLTEERMLKLEAVDFKWTVKVDLDDAWETNYQKLVDFHGKFANILVRKGGEYHSLAKWVYRQRSLCKKKKMGDKDAITDARVNKLNSIQGWE